MFQERPWTLFHGDSMEVLRELPSCSIDSMVTDPPAGIGLLGLEWDKDKGGRDAWIKWLTEIMGECRRVLKPGAHAFVWAIPRTSHWTATALENAGFEVRDVVTHVFGSGFPKNLALDKAMDRARVKDTAEIYRVTAWIKNRCRELGVTNARLDEIAGVHGGACHWTAVPPSNQPAIPTLERWQKMEPVLGPPPEWMKPLIQPAYQLGESWSEREVTGAYARGGGGMVGKRFAGAGKITAPASAEAMRWHGWGTALKPASEHWILVRKPMSEHNTAANVLKFRTGGIHIDACRIPTEDKIPSAANLDFKSGTYMRAEGARSTESIYHPHLKGRFPSDLVFTRTGEPDCPITVLDEMVPAKTSPSRYFKVFDVEVGPFFYCAKPSRREKGADNHHPTVKPLALMRYLCRMITPPGGTVLDPFTGSGTTGVAALQESFCFTGIEREQCYHEIAERRLSEASSSVGSTTRRS
jgi:hypothetical protein